LFTPLGCSTCRLISIENGISWNDALLTHNFFIKLAELVRDNGVTHSGERLIDEDYMNEYKDYNKWTTFKDSGYGRGAKVYKEAFYYRGFKMDLITDIYGREIVVHKISGLSGITAWINANAKTIYAVNRNTFMTPSAKELAADFNKPFTTNIPVDESIEISASTFIELFTSANFSFRYPEFLNILGNNFADAWAEGQSDSLKSVFVNYGLSISAAIHSKTAIQFIEWWKGVLNY